MGLPLPPSAEARAFPIVCLCGSAGALSAYREILEYLKLDTGMAFVVVSHRGRQYTDLLLPLLARQTKMSVTEIEHGTCIKPNSVLLGPPHQRMTTDGINVHLHEEREAGGWPTLITAFLRSVARLEGARAVVVILSGLGNDGSTALEAVKASGGTIIVQSGAVYDSMPLRAIATGHVDLILSPARSASNCHE